MMDGVRFSPFHARLAARNSTNAWVERSGYSMPAHYGDPHQEALAAHQSAGLFDISYTDDLLIQGPGAAALLSRACGAGLQNLAAGLSASVHWRSDGGGLRGAGIVSCLAGEAFLLRASNADIGWFAAAASRFGTHVCAVGQARGLLFLTGPFAIAVLVAAGFEVTDLVSLGHRALSRHGLAFRIFRTMRPAGFEIFCAAGDAPELFDRLEKAGRELGLRLAGENARQILELESGFAQAFADFPPAREPMAAMPALALDDGDKTMPEMLMGIALESDEPMPFAAVTRDGKEIGRTLRSAYSPAWRGALALASLGRTEARVGSAVMVGGKTPGRLVSLPFLD